MAAVVPVDAESAQDRGTWLRFLGLEALTGDWRTACLRLAFILPWTPVYAIWSIHLNGPAHWAGAHGADALAVVRDEALILIGCVLALSVVLLALSKSRWKYLVAWIVITYIGLAFGAPPLWSAGWYA